MEQLYEMIFKRKSFRRFDENLSLTLEELHLIEQQLKLLKPLVSDIEVKFKIVKRDETSCKRGEYCLLIYSECKEHYLLNVGYLVAQLDLWMARHDIGACWYGMGKPKRLVDEKLDYIIMLAFGKASADMFRKDYKKAARKPLDVIWSGDSLDEISNVVRYAPSACNSQTWRVSCDKNFIEIYRSTEVKSIIPIAKRAFYHSIDLGIFLCFLELTLKHHQYSYEKTLCEEVQESLSLVPIAQYVIASEESF